MSNLREKAFVRSHIPGRKMAGQGMHIQGRTAVRQRRDSRGMHIDIATIAAWVFHFVRL